MRFVGGGSKIFFSEDDQAGNAYRKEVHADEASKAKTWKGIARDQ
jgi:hypothetical protein